MSYHQWHVAGSCAMEAEAEACQTANYVPVVPGEAPAAAALPAKRAKPAAPKPVKKARRADEDSTDAGERAGPGEPPEPTEYARNRPRREVGSHLVPKPFTPCWSAKMRTCS